MSLAMLSSLAMIATAGAPGGTFFDTPARRRDYEPAPVPESRQARLTADEEFPRHFSSADQVRMDAAQRKRERKAAKFQGRG